jgi:cytochrome bd-type quinol oxidase subunit 2
MDFALFGFFTLFIGCGSVFIGMVCIGVYWLQARAANEDDRKEAWRKARRAVLLMLVNFPVAGLLAWIGLRLVGFHVSN